MHRILAEIPRSANRCIRVVQLEMQGEVRTTVQEYDLHRSGRGEQWIPARAAVTVHPRQLPQLIEALSEAQRQIEEAGPTTPPAA